MDLKEKVETDFAAINGCMQKEFPELNFQEKGDECTGANSSGKIVLRIHITSDCRVVIRNRRDGQGDEKIFKVLEAFRTREELEKKYVRYVPGMQAASHFEINY